MSRTLPHKHGAYLRLCHAAFNCEPEGERFLRSVTAKGYTLLAHIDGTQYQVADAYIFEGKGEIVVAFQGTERRGHEWLKNLSLGLVREDKNLYVHRGFSRVMHETATVYDFTAAERTEPAKKPDFMEAVLAKAKQFACGEEKKKLVFCGHSLGGALACLAAEKTGRDPSFAVLNQQLAKVITFGAPRVGNAGWRHSFDKATTHSECTAYVTPRDIVPKVPFKHLGFVDSIPKTVLPDNTRISGYTLQGRMDLHGLSLHSQGLRAIANDTPAPIPVATSQSAVLGFAVRPGAMIASYCTRVALSLWCGTAMRELREVVHDIPRDLGSFFQRIRDAAASERQATKPPATEKV